jgi:hypothetical protein
LPARWERSQRRRVAAGWRHSVAAPLQVLGLEPGITGKSCHRRRTDFLVIVESECKIRPTRTAKTAMRADLPLDAPTDAFKRG